MDDSPVVEIRIDRVRKKTDWKEIGGGDRDKWKELVPSINPGNTEANRHSEQDGRILKGR